MNNPLVSIVIPSYNSLSLIENCLNSFLHTTYPNYEIVITDDCSKDGSYEKIQEIAKNSQKIKVFRNLKNSGPSVTRNNSLQHAQGLYVAFLETDMEVEPGWLEPLVNELENNSELGAVQSKILQLQDKNIISSDGIYFDPHTLWVSCPNIGLPSEMSTNHKYIGTGAVGSLFRKEILDTIGYFDEKIVHNIDDLDLCWRTYLAGYKIKLIPESITYHWTMKSPEQRNSTTPKLSSEIHSQKTLRILLKNYEWINIIRYTPWLYFAFFLRAFTNLLRGNTLPFQGLFKATLWNISVLQDTLRERKRLQKIRKASDKQIMDIIGLKGSFFKILNTHILPSFNVNKLPKESDPKKCYICSSPLAISEKIGPLWIKYHYLTCANCTGGILTPYPTQEGYQEKYSEETYYQDLSKPAKNKFIDRLLNLKIYTLPADYINRKYPKGKILDVGCGNGEFLQTMQQYGWQVSGADISKIALKNTRQRIGDSQQLLHGDFSNLELPHQYSLITFWHVLEHIDNFQEYIKKAYDNLEKQGHIIGEVPNYNSFAFRFFKDDYNWIMLPEHNLYHSQKSLEKILAENNFKNIKIHCPNRAILNTALSFRKSLVSKQIPSTIATLLMVITLPVSLLVGVIAGICGKGEVLFFEAEK